MEILRVVSDVELEELTELYRLKYGPNDFHYLGFCTQLKWNRQLKEMGKDKAPENKENDKWLSFRKTFYTHREGDFRRYGTYVSVHFDMVCNINSINQLNLYIELTTRCKQLPFTHGNLVIMSYLNVYKIQI